MIQKQNGNKKNIINKFELFFMININTNIL